MLSVTDAIRRRRSRRAFTAQPVAEADLRHVLELAARAPSSSNVQPWKAYALTGAPLADLKAEVRERLAIDPRGEAPEYPIYARDLKDPYNTRRLACAEALYGLLGVARDNRMGRMMQFARNFDFYGAPVGVIVTLDRGHERGQWADVGIYLAHLLLAAEERGLAACAQAAWAAMHRTLRAHLRIPNEHLVYCGVSLGYADPAAPINALEIRREPLEATTTILGFEPATATA